MLTLDSILQIPDHVLFTKVDDDAVLLNTRTNQYFSLDEVGARFWNLLTEGKSLRAASEMLADEYEVEGAQLERDLLSLVERLMEHGLVESVSA
jgi:hypothetical protein